MILNHKRKSRAALILSLSVVLLLSLWRLAGWVVRFADESLQMDLSASYTAGEALNHGLSPYRSHAIWDGVDLFQHSRFLYPPQVAVLFRPLAGLSYAGAKRLWLALSVAAVIASLVLTGRVYGLGRRWTLILAAAVVIALPERRGSPWMTPALADLIRDKYIFGEGLLLLALLGHLTHALANTEKTNE